VGEGLGPGVGVGVAVGVGEPEEALTAPPPQPIESKRKDKNSTQHMIFEPMGDGLLHTTALDAAELLDVVLALTAFENKQNRPLMKGRFVFA